MKKILFFMVAILPMILFTACSSDDEGLDNGTKYLSEIVIKEHEKKFGEISEYGELYEQYKYNQDGTIAEKTTNHYVNAVDSRIDYTYKYTYDNQGRLIERNDYELTLFEKKYKYEYNSIDSVSRMMVYDEDGDLNEDWTFEYDNQRRLIKTIEKDIWLSNDFGYISEYTYENNKVYVVKHSIKDGTLFGRYIYEYDSKGNLLQETYISGDKDKESIEQKFEYKYDSLGRIQRKSKKAYLFDNWTYYDYLYNDDGTINKISISYSYKDDESELRYNYVWK